jgi:hypothetical protein
MLCTSSHFACTHVEWFFLKANRCVCLASQANCSICMQTNTLLAVATKPPSSAASSNGLSAIGKHRHDHQRTRAAARPVSMQRRRHPRQGAFWLGASGKGISRQRGLASFGHAGRMQTHRQPWKAATCQHRRSPCCIKKRPTSTPARTLAGQPSLRSGCPASVGLC